MTTFCIAFYQANLYTAYTLPLLHFAPENDSLYREQKKTLDVKIRCAGVRLDEGVYLAASDIIQEI